MARNKLEKALGDSFEELDVEQMAAAQGAGDTEAETVSVAIASMVSGAVSAGTSYPRQN